MTPADSETPHSQDIWQKRYSNVLEKIKNPIERALKDLIANALKAAAGVIRII